MPPAAMPPPRPATRSPAAMHPGRPAGRGGRCVGWGGRGGVWGGVGGAVSEEGRVGTSSLGRGDLLRETGVLESAVEAREFRSVAEFRGVCWFELPINVLRRRAGISLCGIRNAQDLMRAVYVLVANLNLVGGIL